MYENERFANHSILIGALNLNRISIQDTVQLQLLLIN